MLMSIYSKGSKKPQLPAPLLCVGKNYSGFLPECYLVDAVNASSSVVVLDFQLTRGQESVSIPEPRVKAGVSFQFLVIATRYRFPPA